MAKITEVCEVTRSKLKPYERNAKIHSEEQVQKIADSINEFGFVSPCLIDRDYNIIAGHGRVMAAELLGLETVPCIFIEGLTDEQRRAYILADNRLTELGEWDMDLVEDELIQLDELDFDISVTGFDLDFSEDPKDIIEDDIPEEAEPRCKVGDIWQLGEHRLMCGDSTSAADIDKLMAGEKADMVFTDPPYGLGIDGQKESKAKNPKHNRKGHAFRGWDGERPERSVFDYIVSLNIPSIIFGGNYFADMLPATRGWIYWSKGQDGMTMSDGELAWSNVNKPLRCVTVNRANLGDTVHPTQKPLKVVEFCLNYAGEQKRVLDLFGGSGSTLIACEQLNRKCYMMELDPHYCDVIIERWEQFTGEKAVKL